MIKFFIVIDGVKKTLATVCDESQAYVLCNYYTQVYTDKFDVTVKRPYKPEQIITWKKVEQFT